jgi:Amt family ammonium transporter
MTRGTACAPAAALVLALTFGVSLLTPAAARAADEVITSAPAESVAHIDSGDTAWMLTSAALVLMMTGPGLALFYSGLVRRKNVLATMMQSFILMALVSILWAVVGYTLAFGERNAFIGGFQYLFLNGVGATPNTDYAPTIPHTTWMIYQLMFAIITPALICGAYAERMKFSAMMWFSALWLLFIYCPLAHMVWGKGGLLTGRARISEHPRAGFRGRDGGAHQLGRFGARVRDRAWGNDSATASNRCRRTASCSA